MQPIIITLFFFLSAVSLGFCFTNWALKRNSIDFLHFIFSLICGTVILTYGLFFISLVFRQMIILVNYIFIGIILFSTLYLNLQKLTFSIPKITRKLILTVFGGFLVVLYFWLAFRNLLFYENGNLMSGWITIWGDWQAHLTYATSFAFGNNFPPQLPIFTGQVFSYPFMADFLSAVFISLGVSLKDSLIIPSCLFTTVSFFLLMQIMYQITKKRLISIISTLLFYLNGGFGFIQVFFLGVNANEMTKIADKNIQWISILTSQFIPQRGFAMGFPLALVCIYFLIQIIDKKISFRMFFLFGFLVSLLPLIHMHSFLIIIFLSIAVFIFRTKYMREWIIFSLPIIFIAIPVYFYFYSKGAAFNSFRFHFGWMSKNPRDFFPFYLWNFGLMALLPFIGFIFVPKKIKWLTIPFWIIFILANLFIFQPWDWDNTKLLTYWYLSACLLAGYLLDKMIKSKYSFLSIIGIMIFIICIFSGFSDARTLLHVPGNKLQMFSSEQIQVAQFIRDNTPPNSIFLTADNHDNLVPSLTGRKIALGYPGWLWSYGVNYYPRQQEIDSIKNGDPTAEILLKKLNINYVIIGPTELSQNFKSSVFEKKYKNIYKQGEYAIYQIQ